MKCLEQIPKILQDAVKKYSNGKTVAPVILSTSVIEETPYKDKTILDTTYKVYIEFGNLLSVFKYRTSTKPGFGDLEVQQNHMLVGEIDIFLNHSRWFKNRG